VVALLNDRSRIHSSRFTAGDLFDTLRPSADTGAWVSANEARRRPKASELLCD
jgi:hypothetical protein